jgi:hypothetical protein
MSIDVMNEVWKDAPVEQGALLVLLALADSADDVMRTCYPGVQSLAKKSRLSVRQVQYCLKDLRDRGIISVQRNASPVKTNLYKIEPAARWKSDRSAKTAPLPDVQSTTCRDEVDCVSETQPTAPKSSVTSVEPSESPKPPEGASDLFSANGDPVEEKTEPDRFDEFWKVYPKKAGKPAAQKAWAKAVKRAPAQTIIDGARRYAHWLSQGGPKDFRPIPKFPQGWLNDDRWDDEEIRHVRLPDEVSAEDRSRRFAPQWGEVVR